jgi:hypothetical protein
VLATLDLAGIRAAAERFRAAIVAFPDTKLVGLNNFPRGSCGDASVLLGQYLYDAGFGIWDYVSGERVDDLWSHAWIEKDGVIVDITADQFDEVDAKVIVTRDHEWHHQFQLRDLRHVAILDMYDEDTCSQLTEAYKRIAAAVKRLT